MTTNLQSLTIAAVKLKFSGTILSSVGNASWTPSVARSLRRLKLMNVESPTVAGELIGAILALFDDIDQVEVDDISITEPTQTVHVTRRPVRVKRISVVCSPTSPRLMYPAQTFLVSQQLVALTVIHAQTGDMDGLADVIMTHCHTLEEIDVELTGAALGESSVARFPLAQRALIMCGSSSGPHRWQTALNTASTVQRFSFTLPFPSMLRSTPTDRRRCVSAVFTVARSLPGRACSFTLVADVRWAVINNPMDLFSASEWNTLDSILAEQSLIVFTLVMKIAWTMEGLDETGTDRSAGSHSASGGLHEFVSSSVKRVMSRCVGKLDQ